MCMNDNILYNHAATYTYLFSTRHSGDSSTSYQVLALALANARRHFPNHKPTLNIIVIIAHIKYSKAPSLASVHQVPDTFSHIHSAVACLRGPRSSFHAPVREINLIDHPLDLIHSEVHPLDIDSATV